MFQLAYAGVLTGGEETATNLKDAIWLLRADQTSQLVAGAWYIEQRKSCWQAKQTVGSQEPQAFGEKYLSPEWPQPATDFRRWLLSLMASTLFTHSFPTAKKGYVCREQRANKGTFIFMHLCFGSLSRGSWKQWMQKLYKKHLASLIKINLIWERITAF